MLCPSCRRATAGGAICPTCQHPVPDRESFEGQGDRYLRLLAICSLFLMLGSSLVVSHGFYDLEGIRSLWVSGNFWIVLLLCLAPTIVGIYYWALLHEEEIIVTDEQISRTSHWGNERIAWQDVQAFNRRAVHFGETRLGQMARLGRLFRENERLWDQLPISYELIARDPETGREVAMLLEPGAIEDMPWLLALIEERVGPATHVRSALPI